MPVSGLSGKIVLITGAKGGLGSSVTEAFLAEGATVAGVSRTIQDSDFPGDRFVAFPAELSSRDAGRGVADQVIARFGQINALVHLVGGFEGGTNVAETDDETFEQMIEANLRSAFHIVRAVIPHMRERRYGRVVAVGSRAAVEANAGAGAYSASKAALVALIRAVALENKGQGITANTVLPGTMDTPGNRKAMPTADPAQWVQPTQVANLIVSLASDAFPQVSGSAIPIYGAEL
jgi:NAD(P)-dependent dehydrogenase (short-subunit alcohol dehydrogenase family)